MTPTQIALVQRSFKKVMPIGDTTAQLFYGRLFALDPALEALFKIDLREQGRKLIGMIGLAVTGLNDLATLVPAVADLGRRHAGYGVRPEHYDTVGAALLWTLERGLEDAFTPEVKDAWTAAYGLLAGTMKQAAYGGAPTAA
jgi:hemoglobin-like flavoprotein